MISEPASINRQEKRKLRPKMRRKGTRLKSMVLLSQGRRKKMSREETL